MEIFLMIRRHKTTILLDTKENATVADVKRLLAGIIKRPPEDQKLAYERQILDDSEELRQYFQARAQSPATIGLMLRDEETGEFEQLHITPYSEPPELPSAMENDDERSNESVRLAAAKQLGEVQRIQPNDLLHLLQRIKEYSGKSVWETRVAAGHATRCVLEQVETWPPMIRNQQSDDKMKSLQELADKVIEENVNLEQILENFNLERIMSHCPKLLSLDLSESSDNIISASTSCSKGTAKTKGRGKRESSSKSFKNDKETLMRQRKLINKELGIMDSLNIGVKSTDIVSNDDLQAEYEISDSLKSTTTSQDPRVILQSSASNYEKVLMALEQSECITILKTDTSSGDEIAEDDKMTKQLDLSWPLMNLTKQYTNDLFNPSWEIRHGAAIALREIVRLQGKSAGKRLDLQESSNHVMNQIWLIDMALKSISVLAMDKFGDFLFDQVIAPVRENVAQLLGCCVAHLSEKNACAIMKLVLSMLENQNWETRHGGVLGLKYCLNVVDESFSRQTLNDCFELIFSRLGDPVDDVSAEAAAALVPVKDLMMETSPEKAPRLIKFLWDHLADLDELTTSTSNIVLLLASLITSSSTQLEPSELEKAFPRLWPLLGHSSSTVRISVLKAIKTLLDTHKSTCLSCMPEVLITTMLRMIFQRAILEHMEEVRFLIEEVWVRLISISESTATNDRFNLLRYTSQFLNYWLCLVMQPVNTPIDRNSSMWLNIGPDGYPTDTKQDGDLYIASYTFNAETINHQKIQVTRCRLLGTRLLGSLYANLTNDFSESNESQHAKETFKYLSEMFCHYIKTKSANQRIVSGWTLESWAECQALLMHTDSPEICTLLPQNLKNQMCLAIQEVSICYDELASTFTRLQQETRDFVAALRDANISPNILIPSDRRAIFNLSQINLLSDLNLEAEITKSNSKRGSNATKASGENYDVTASKLYTQLTEKRDYLNKSLKNTIQSQKSLTTSVLSSLACAHISWQIMPDKLSLIINPIIDAIEIEEEQPIQDKFIKHLVRLIDYLSKDLARNEEVVGNVLKRLIDISICQALSYSNESLTNAPQSLEDAKISTVKKYRILSLDDLKRKAEKSLTNRRQSSVSGTLSLKRSHSNSFSLDNDSEQSAIQEEPNRTNVENSEVKIRGASATLSKLVKHFGDQLPSRLPMVWRLITSDIQSQISSYRDQKDSIQEINLVKSLRVLEIAGESLSENLRSNLLDLFKDLIHLLSTPSPVIRYNSAQCIAIISKMMFSDTIEMIKKKIVPMLEMSEDTLARCGSIEAIGLIIEHLQLDLVPKINMFVLHVLRRMSDQIEQIRLVATHCFGKLLSLMPLNLEKKKENFVKIEPELEATDANECNFIEQLLDSKKIENFVVPFKMETELRSYQQDGLNWLAFLNRYNLHGILCDEMGLGKTFMTICIVASDHIITERQCLADGESEYKCRPSLIICPTTLTEHWLHEINKFLPQNIRSSLNPIIYGGSITERTNIRCKIISSPNNCNESNKKSNSKEHAVNLVIASYDIVRNDIDFFKEVSWNYSVLDEGHMIKNGKTKLSRAIRLLSAKHRLILSGTPIQNNVTELWSLFDFLMPGFLGSDRQFNSGYAKPILQSREVKCSSRELEAGALAMESLHRQVLPFILRRTKEDVLDDLPPKIIQDYYCELSPLQNKLYEDFTRSKLCEDVTKKSIFSLDEKNSDESFDVRSSSKSHVFQALQYLKNVCNHPKLVLTPDHSQYKSIRAYLDKEKSSLDDINHSSKLTALMQLLIDCGIVVQGSDEQQQPQPQQTHQQAIDLQSVINQHRALIFCQIRSMVNIIENDLLKKHLPNITYLKLDGSVPANQRHSIVSRFNNDPSIDILLLTTQIGGLGLNLTGADTVIFVEHDWNPTKDLQAMDRAHRIGQRKVVNVYRLITKGTLEEKIMGLQKFKIMVSNTVINQDNAGMGTMNVDQLFDLFEGTVKNSEQFENNRSYSGKSTKSTSFMDMFPELWDRQEYETEYDLSNFVSSLKN